MADLMTKPRLTKPVMSNARMVNSRFTVPGGEVATRIIRLAGDLAFGDVTVDETSGATLTIYNDGNATLSVSNITFPSGFARDIGGDGTFEVAAGGSDAVYVTFSPTEATSYGGTITVVADETSGTDTIECSGTGVAAVEAEATYYTLATNDDGAYKGVSLYMDDLERTIGNKSGNLYNFWARFIVAVPKGATITESYLTIQGLAGGTYPVDMLLKGWDIDDSGDSADVPVNMPAGDRTTATVAWQLASGTPWITSNQSPDIKTVIQEIVNRDGWETGNSLIITAEPENVYNKYVLAYFYDKGESYRPSLYVKWTA